ncbi:unnamed protein product [Didymodactylos carnosus]|uniref:Uncharacterized protein n=1 Tax=Didymodactylos carnosus TaxID=1234261 RepID=A0A814RZ20_9BILA|nr:unnamed protein product [Didymodactylos carnosus]CAF1314416.1 unnamed protein product [Didymodactylos carnosus]CAF3904331.1 unnamed protein product [Didymodactylos carnosus]CAF4123099.1 unnamed protein product [Didymodactylos carnosus]
MDNNTDNAELSLTDSKKKQLLRRNLSANSQSSPTLRRANERTKSISDSPRSGVIRGGVEHTRARARPSGRLKQSHVINRSQSTEIKNTMLISPTITDTTDDDDVVIEKKRKGREIRERVLSYFEELECGGYLCKLCPERKVRKIKEQLNCELC